MPINKALPDLVLPLKREYFEQIKRGEKPEDFRLCTPYWAKRLEGREYGRVVLTLGILQKMTRIGVCRVRGGVLSSAGSRISTLGVRRSMFMQLM